MSCALDRFPVSADILMSLLQEPIMDCWNNHAFELNYLIFTLAPTLSEDAYAHQRFVDDRESCLATIKQADVIIERCLASINPFRSDQRKALLARNAEYRNAVAAKDTALNQLANLPEDVTKPKPIAEINRILHRTIFPIARQTLINTAQYCVLQEKELITYSRTIPLSMHPEVYLNIIFRTISQKDNNGSNESKEPLLPLFGPHKTIVELFSTLLNQLSVESVKPDSAYINFILTAVLGEMDIAALSQLNTLVRIQLQRRLATCITDTLFETALPLFNSNAPYLMAHARMTMDKSRFQEIVNQATSHYPQLFPEARILDRHFVIHVGPTNSGKTYAALQALKEAKSGAYLSPLRLLASEVHQTLSETGIATSLITGEERNYVPNATHYASTIEMANYEHAIDVCVIDEAQMVGDKFRGGAWSRAICGIPAKTLHICCAPNALDVIVRLIEWCNESYEVVTHTRKTPLRFDGIINTINFKNIRQGDCLVVFSRSHAHRLASSLIDAGKRVSLIYGTLPYSTKQEETIHFAQGDTDIVVATDCIGMGLNLPIKRVIFMESSKYDGEKRRLLTSNEIAQIAGRAGRFGIHEEGRWAISTEAQRVRKLQALWQKPIEPVSHYYLGFPKNSVPEGMDFTQALSLWNQLGTHNGVHLQNVKDILSRAQYLTRRGIPNSEIPLLSSLNVNMNSSDSVAEWERIIRLHLGEAYDGPSQLILDHPSIDNLSTLESLYRLCDLWCAYYWAMNYSEEALTMQELRSSISQHISRVLDAHDLEKSRCLGCGKILKWNSRYSYCYQCAHKTDQQREPSE